MTPLTLKGIITCSFGRSEATNLDLYRKSKGFPGELKAGEAFLFISRGLNQVIFIFEYAEVEVDNEHDLPGGDNFRSVLDSRRLRLGGGTWHPYMLQNYANAVGLNLEGIRTLQQILDERRREIRAPKPKR